MRHRSASASPLEEHVLLRGAAGEKEEGSEKREGQGRGVEAEDGGGEGSSGGWEE